MGAPTAQLSLVHLGLQHASAHVQALEVSLRRCTQTCREACGMLCAWLTWARVAGRVVQLSMRQLGVRNTVTGPHSQVREQASYSRHQASRDRCMMQTSPTSVCGRLCSLHHNELRANRPSPSQHMQEGTEGRLHA